jgi:hypothetical protein
MNDLTELEAVMKRICMLSLVLLLGGCTAGGPIAGGEASTRDEAVLTPLFFAPKFVEVELYGKRYSGAWATVPGQDPERWKLFGGAVRHHVAHMREAQAALDAADGARLTCRWVSHHADVNGTCVDGEGRRYRLQTM